MEGLLHDEAPYIPFQTFMSFFTVRVSKKTIPHHFDVSVSDGLEYAPSSSSHGIVLNVTNVVFFVKRWFSALVVYKNLQQRSLWY
ncbi:hypothetical protein CEXT_563841 [Caerostris extrusa]|uniref:Uncharacterized protein n=1 Tax=Caerostris extrusa TaxID=172846 RepID=A0AAV4Y6N3_CAEEX|nr:hypothetical protein CEXT_563841 [Caerostris extrusa]